jgi:hypothetical protein
LGTAPKKKSLSQPSEVQAKSFFVWFWLFKTLPHHSLITHVFISAPVSSRPHTFHARAKESQSDKKEITAFFRDATFCL